MAKMTSAYANKVLRRLNDDKDFYLNKEQEGQVYVASLDEEPVVPDYDYSDVSSKIAEIDAKIVKIKHAINVTNVTSTVMVGGADMSIDAVLVKMAQFNKRKSILDAMRKRQEKTRVSAGYFTSRKTAPEYQYINYDLETVNKEYERIDGEIAEMQIALDKFNQTFEFEVEV
ncbi:hypothetical protein SAMN04487928_14032 [Butyrivibrio proteoclasticus]|uniref:Uncharacterized protein n=1 Tax=Butyrivibrio proteoclasticus TaxID=43305 RepID=A0A1I5Y3Z0_9FIRM|nr:hypothetical protein [Butyrivibrio proteoclasticus]SFQ38899.1 hypothetical protein SAMN04487928_14032 [Butyrivibrio proteoclasticus]